MKDLCGLCSRQGWLQVTAPGLEGWLLIADTFPAVDCSSRIIEKVSLVLLRNFCQRKGATGFQRCAESIGVSSESNDITQIMDKDIPSSIFAHILRERKRYLFHWARPVAAFRQNSIISSPPLARTIKITKQGKSASEESLTALDLSEMFFSSPVSATPIWPVWMFADRIQGITLYGIATELKDLKIV